MTSTVRYLQGYLIGTYIMEVTYSCLFEPSSHITSLKQIKLGVGEDNDREKPGPFRFVIFFLVTREPLLELQCSIFEYFMLSKSK